MYNTLKLCFQMKMKSQGSTSIKHQGLVNSFFMSPKKKKKARPFNSLDHGQSLLLAKTDAFLKHTSLSIFQKKNRQHPFSRMNKQNKTNLKAWGEFFSVRGSASTRYSLRIVLFSVADLKKNLPLRKFNSETLSP